MIRWADIPGYEGLYSVSTSGAVYSYRSGKNLRPGRMSSGHLSVSLGRRNSRCVHELVLLTFIGPRPQGCECRHINGEPWDNRLNNLEWASRSKNTQDKKWHKGASTYVLTPKDVRHIRRMYAEGAPGPHIASQFGVCDTTIYNVIHRKTHKDVN